MEFSIFRGDTFEFDFVSTSVDGSPYIFKKGDLLKFGVKEKFSNTRYLLYKEVRIEEEAEEVAVMFTPEETRKCSKGDKILEVELTDNEGKVRTLFQGKLTVKEDLINERNNK